MSRRFRVTISTGSATAAAAEHSTGRTDWRVVSSNSSNKVRRRLILRQRVLEETGVWQKLVQYYKHVSVDLCVQKVHQHQGWSWIIGAKVFAPASFPPTQSAEPEAQPGVVDSTLSPKNKDQWTQIHGYSHSMSGNFGLSMKNIYQRNPRIVVLTILWSCVGSVSTIYGTGSIWVNSRNLSRTWPVGDV